MPRRNYLKSSKIRVDRRRYYQLEKIALTRIILKYGGADVLNLDMENAYLVAKYSESTLEELTELSSGIIELVIIPPNGEIRKSTIHIDR